MAVELLEHGHSEQQDPSACDQRLFSESSQPALMTALSGYSQKVCGWPKCLQRCWAAGPGRIWRWTSMKSPVAPIKLGTCSSSSPRSSHSSEVRAMLQQQLLSSKPFMWAQRSLSMHPAMSQGHSTAHLDSPNWHGQLALDTPSRRNLCLNSAQQ